MDNYSFWLGEDKKSWTEIHLERAVWVCYIHEISGDVIPDFNPVYVSRNVKGELVYERI